MLKKRTSSVKDMLLCARYRLIVSLCVILILLLVGCLEDRFLYFPAKYPAGAWQTSNLGFSVEDCFFRTADGLILHGWFVPKEGKQACILWFHGNRGNITHKLNQLALMRRLGVNIFIIDYRGYGRSQGYPSENGLYLDAEAAYQYLTSRPEVSSEQIYLYGHSLGAAVALYLAHKGWGAGVILEAGFTSLLDIAIDIYPWLPVRLLTQERYNSIERIRQLGMPLLVINGSEDETIPIKHSQQLYQAAPNPKELLVISGAGHNNIYLLGGEEYWSKMKKFIN